MTNLPGTSSGGGVGISCLHRLHVDVESAAFRIAGGDPVCWQDAIVEKRHVAVVRRCRALCTAWQLGSDKRDTSLASTNTRLIEEMPCTSMWAGASVVGC